MFSHDILENSHNAFLVSGSYPIAVVLHWASTKLSFPPICSEITASRKQLDLLSSIFLYAMSIFWKQNEFQDMLWVYSHEVGDPLIIFGW